MSSWAEIELGTVLFAGASSRIYRGSFRGRTAAIKVANCADGAAEASGGPCEALLRLRHPAVVEVLGCGRLADGRPYVAMALLSGEPLSERLARAPLAVGEAIPLFLEVAAGLSALHAAGLVHRDVKPENILLVDGGQRPMLVDLGLARESVVPATLGTTTARGKVHGTAAYMAPERFFGAPANVATDLYELAVVLYAMLLGRLPWPEGVSPEDPQSRRDPVRPKTRGLSLPGRLEPVLLRALSTRPEARWPTVAAFADAVAQAARSTAPPLRRTIELSPPGPTAPRSLGKVRPQTGSLWILLASLAFGVAMVSFALLGRRPARASAPRVLPAACERLRDLYCGDELRPMQDTDRPCDTLRDVLVHADLEDAREQARLATDCAVRLPAAEQAIARKHGGGP